MIPTPLPPLRMPAEWEPHEATWIAWPHQRADWPGKFAAIPWVYCRNRSCAASERKSPYSRQRHYRREKAARSVLAKLPLAWDRIVFFHLPTDRVWTRDYGPMTVWDGHGTRGCLDWRFNGWAKYPNWKRDNAATKRLLAPSLWQFACRPQLHGRQMVLEGGSIDVNGAGLLLTTEECLLSDVQPRNPGFTRQDYEQAFATYLGVQKTLWLNRGIAGDDTHGHVDDLARFVGPRTVAAVVEDDPNDENYRTAAGEPDPFARHDRPARPAAEDRNAADAVAAVCSTANGCRQVTRTSTSPTTACSCRRSTMPTIARP